MSNLTPITVAHGDGIGPEIMEATLHILKEAGARLDIETIAIGEKVYLEGNSAGIAKSAWESLSRTKVFLKAPITTPQGGGFKSLNVTTRKMLGLYANVRPCVAYHPYVDTKHPETHRQPPHAAGGGQVFLLAARQPPGGTSPGLSSKAGR